MIFKKFTTIFVVQSVMSYIIDLNNTHVSISKREFINIYNNQSFGAGNVSKEFTGKIVY